MSESTTAGAAARVPTFFPGALAHHREGSTMQGEPHVIDMKTLTLAASGVVIRNFVDCQERGVLATIEDDPLATGLINALHELRRRLADFEHETPEERLQNIVNDARQAITDLLDVKGLSDDEIAWAHDALHRLLLIAERQLSSSSL